MSASAPHPGKPDVQPVQLLTGLPINYHAARHGVDMSLLTRGAGFGYIGSTISSFVYASFTFILLVLVVAPLMTTAGRAAALWRCNRRPWRLRHARFWCRDRCWGLVERLLPIPTKQSKQGAPAFP
jgi:hypothetical protein